MEISRRDFLKLGALALATIAGSRITQACTPFETDASQTSELPIDPTAIPKPTEKVYHAGDYEFISQSEIETKLKGPFEYFKNDKRIQNLFKDPSTIEYTAGGIKVFDANSQPTAYTFFSATSEAEHNSRIAMVFGGKQSEVSYVVLNRMLSENKTVGLGITQDPATGRDLEKSVLIFDTGLSEEQVATMTPQQLSSMDVKFVPGGIIVPSDKILGTKQAMLAKPEAPKENVDYTAIDIDHPLETCPVITDIEAYREWLKNTPVEPFSPNAKLRPLRTWDGGEPPYPIQFDPNTDKDYADPTTWSFRQSPNIVSYKSGQFSYLLLPTYWLNPNNPSKPYVTLSGFIYNYGFGNPPTEKQLSQYIKAWISHKPAFWYPAVNNGGKFGMGNENDYLETQTAKHYPDIKNRMYEFINTGNAASVSESNIILEPQILLN